MGEGEEEETEINESNDFPEFIEINVVNNFEWLKHVSS